MSIRLSSQKLRYSRCLTSTVVSFEDKFSLLFYNGLLLIVYFFCICSQYYITPANIGTIGKCLAEHKSTWMDNYTSHAVAGIFVKYRWFFVVCHKYSQASAKISLSGGTGSSCGFSFCGFSSRYRKLYFGSHKSRNTAVLAQFVTVRIYRCH